MARPLRIEFAGAYYHLISRGNERRNIVVDDLDRQERLRWLRRTVQTYGWRLHAFVLMTNHEHLFVETPEPNLSAGMHYLNSCYAGAFNRRHQRVGHLLQGRYKSHIVDNEGYFLEVSRYIHLNPVRARMVAAPEQYRWSSYRGYHRASRALRWVTYDRVLAEVGCDARQARAVYRRFVQAGIDEAKPAPWANARHGLIVGSEVFIERIRRIVPELEEGDDTVTARGEPLTRPSLAAIITEVRAASTGSADDTWCRGTRVADGSRALAAYIARRRFGYRSSEVAAAVGYACHSSVSKAVSRIQAGPEAVRTLADQLEQRLVGVSH